MLKRFIAGLFALGLLLLAHPARAAIEFTFSSSGTVFPTDPANCADPFQGCSLTAIGTATALAGNTSPLPGPWNFTATFAIVQPLSATTFRTTGAFAFDDPSGANNDFSGLLDGVLDATTFSNAMSYIVTSGSGLFAAGYGIGSSVIQINRQDFSFVERGQFAIPEPGTLTLLGLALAGLAATRGRKQ